MKVRVISKVTAALLSFICMLTILQYVPTQTITASATEVTQTEALNWVRSQVGKSIDYDGVYGAQCVDLVKAYYNYLGVSPVTGNGADYTWNTLPDGWQRIEGIQPQPGDILVYTNGYGHVAIYESDYITYHQNFNSNQFVQKITTVAYNKLTNPYWSVIRPNFKIEQPTKWYDDLTPANLGDIFFATIQHSASGRVLTAEENGNVAIHALPDEMYLWRYTWQFERSAEGWYRIKNSNNLQFLDVVGANPASGTNVQFYGNHDTPAQKWYIYSTGSAYYFRSAVGDCALDVYGGLGNEGDNIQMWNYHGGSSQQFSINKVTTPGNTKLTVQASTEAEDTLFTWENDSNAFSYSLCLWNGTCWEGDAAYQIEVGNVNQYALKIPAGYYEGYVDAKNQNGFQMSNIVKFTVGNAPVQKEDGWTYADVLPSGITASDYEIQYQNTYQTTAAASPGADWVKGDFAKSQYENVGEPYESNIELETSDSRVLVSYYYYHYCSGAKGNEANYEQNDIFVHYDSLPASGVYEFSTGLDAADNRYRYYYLDWDDGSHAFCKSGTTCSGIAGEHGERSYVWYRCSKYQDREKVDYYYYTKKSDWTTTADAEATVSYRYRLKQSTTTATTTTTSITSSTALTTSQLQKGEGLLGDANLDGKVDLLDVIVLNKFLANVVQFSETQRLCADCDQTDGIPGQITEEDADKLTRFTILLIDTL